VQPDVASVMPVSGRRGDVRYPLVSDRPRTVDRLVERVRRVPFRCAVCGSMGVSKDFGRDSLSFRERGECRRCDATTRQRQVGWLVARAMSRLGGGAATTLAAAVRTNPTIAVYNTEARGPVHAQLSQLAHYRASEYFGPERRGGDIVDGVEHQDLQDLSLADESVDIIISSDVFEHLARPYDAHREVYRVLRDGGRHIFTVPFHQNGYRDERRAVLDGDGAIEHLAEPIYHLDPVSADGGVLVFTIFALEMLIHLREIGFVPVMYQQRSLVHGFFGANAIIFEATKTKWGWA
jgi:SAM-dependent methyltransferase